MSDDEDLETLRQIALMSMKSRRTESSAVETVSEPVEVDHELDGAEESEGEETSEELSISLKSEDDDDFLKDIEDFENFLNEKPESSNSSKKTKKKKKKPVVKEPEKQSLNSEDKENRFEENELSNDGTSSPMARPSRSPSPEQRYSPARSHRSLSPFSERRSRSPYSQRSHSPWKTYGTPRASQERYFLQRSHSRSQTPDSVYRHYSHKRRNSASPTETECRQRRRSEFDNDVARDERYMGARAKRKRYVPAYDSNDPELQKFEEERRKRGEERRRKQEEYLKNRKLVEENRRNKFEEERKQWMEEKRLKEEEERKRKEEEECKKRKQEEEERRKEEEDFQEKLSHCSSSVERERLIARREKFLSKNPIKIEGGAKIILKHIKTNEPEREDEEAEVELEEEDESGSNSESESRFKKRKRAIQEALEEPVPKKRQLLDEEQIDPAKAELGDLRATLERKRAMRKKKKPKHSKELLVLQEERSSAVQEPDEVPPPRKKAKSKGRRVLILRKEEDSDEVQFKNERKKATITGDRMSAKSMIQRLGLPIKSEMTSGDARQSRVSRLIQQRQEEDDQQVLPFSRLLRRGIVKKGIDG